MSLPPAIVGPMPGSSALSATPEDVPAPPDAEDDPESEPPAAKRPRWQPKTVLLVLAAGKRAPHPEQGESPAARTFRQTGRGRGWAVHDVKTGRTLDKITTAEKEDLRRLPTEPMFRPYYQCVATDDTLPQFPCKPFVTIALGYGDVADRKWLETQGVDILAKYLACDGVHVCALVEVPKKGVVCEPYLIATFIAQFPCVGRWDETVHKMREEWIGVLEEGCREDPGLRRRFGACNWRACVKTPSMILMPWSPNERGTHVQQPVGPLCSGHYIWGEEIVREPIVQARPEKAVREHQRLDAIVTDANHGGWGKLAHRVWTGQGGRYWRRQPAKTEGITRPAAVTSLIGGYWEARDGEGDEFLRDYDKFLHEALTQPGPPYFFYSQSAPAAGPSRLFFEIDGHPADIPPADVEIAREQFPRVLVAFVDMLIGTCVVPVSGVEGTPDVIVQVHEPRVWEGDKWVRRMDKFGMHIVFMNTSVEGENLYALEYLLPDIWKRVIGEHMPEWKRWMQSGPDTGPLKCGVNGFQGHLRLMGSMKANKDKVPQPNSGIYMPTDMMRFPLGSLPTYQPLPATWTVADHQIWCDGRENLRFVVPPDLRDQYVVAHTPASVRNNGEYVDVPIRREDAPEVWAYFEQVLKVRHAEEYGEPPVEIGTVKAVTLTYYRPKKPGRRTKWLERAHPTWPIPGKQPQWPKGSDGSGYYELQWTIKMDHGFCHNRAGEHKSVGMYYVVKPEGIYQRCWSDKPGTVGVDRVFASICKRWSDGPQGGWLLQHITTPDEPHFWDMLFPNYGIGVEDIDEKEEMGMLSWPTRM